MTPPNTNAAAVNSAATKRLFAQLNAFLAPMAKDANLTLRPFSITTFTAMQMAGIAVGSEAFKEMDAFKKANQLNALLVIQTAPLAELKPALRAANGDFEKFYWDFCFDKGAEMPIDGLLELETQLSEEMPAIEAAQVEAVSPEAQKGGSTTRPPGN